jgi:hypothetical protein
MNYAKEKAKELYSKCENAISELEGMQWYESAKRCALIAVEELIIEEQERTDNSGFWQDVKEELQKI